MKQNVSGIMLGCIAVFILGIAVGQRLGPTTEQPGHTEGDSQSDPQTALLRIAESVARIEAATVLPELEHGVVVEHEDLPDGYEFRSGGLLTRIRRPRVTVQRE